MYWRLLFLTFSLQFAILQFASAGETIKFRSQHVNVATSVEEVEVQAKSGYSIVMFQAKGVGIRTEGPPEPAYKIEIWGMGEYRGDGTGKEHGYGKFIFADGSSYYEEWTGKVAEGHAVGTAVYYNGTGRFEGIKGGSSFDCAVMGDRFVCEVEGTIDLP